MLSKVKNLIQSDTVIREQHNRALISKQRVTSAYDMSTICNLRCDGCFFFDKDGNYSGTESSSTSDFELFFQGEKNRGVNYPVFAGAEPGLNQEILHVASKVWDEGMVHTNGTIRIHRDIPFRLYVSCWGHREATDKWRGANCYDKFLKNITGDPRVIVNYTISRTNINDILPVVADCADRGLLLSFQVYSQTEDYLGVINGAGGSYEYAHDSTESDNLVMRAEDNESACEIVKQAIKKFPKTVLYTPDLADWTFSRFGMFDMNNVEKGAPPSDCDVAIDKNHKHYRSDLTLEEKKTCGHPEINCETCRAYTSIYTSYFRHKSTKLNNTKAIKEYFLAHDVFYKIFHVRKDKS